MLTSLLSLYIASSLDLNLADNLIANETIPKIQAKTASFSVSTFNRSNFTPIKNPKE